MLKGAIFDFDGTLFDSMAVWNNIGELYLRSKGYAPKGCLSETLKTMSLHQSSCYLKKEYGMKDSVEEIIDGINRMIEDSYMESVLPKKGVQAFLKVLKENGVRMCIATATDKYLIEVALQRCEMDGYFENILTCSSVGAGKDKPQIFREALRLLNTEKQETIVFEDAYHAIMTAKNDGFSVAGIYDAYEDCEEDVIKVSDVYLCDYEDTEKFWKFVSGK